MMTTLVNDDERQESYLLVIIEPDNLKRMRKADPITLETVAMHGVLPTVKYPERLAVLIAYEEDEVALYKAAQTGSFADMLQFVSRGYKFNRDEDGAWRAFSINKGH
jgi:hypothetical protein